MFYGWKYSGTTESGKHVVCFMNDGSILETKFFATRSKADQFLTNWQERIAEE